MTYSVKCSSQDATKALCLLHEIFETKDVLFIGGLVDSHWIGWPSLGDMDIILHSSFTCADKFNFFAKMVDLKASDSIISGAGWFHITGIDASCLRHYVGKLFGLRIDVFTVDDFDAYRGHCVSLPCGMLITDRRRRMDILRNIISLPAHLCDPRSARWLERKKAIASSKLSVYCGTLL